MKTLVHRVPINDNAPFDLAALKEFLRVDFGEDDAQISNIGWAAAAELEHFAQIALLFQTVRVTLFRPVPCSYGLNLPIGPVADGETPSVLIDGEAFTSFDLTRSLRPYIRWMGNWYDLRPDRIVIEYKAGFGDVAASIPADLAQAIMDQAALHYDGRSPMDPKVSSGSPHMSRIGARYRGVSL